MLKGLYLHIPFCETRCHYCNFVTTAEHVPELKEEFLKAVTAEIIRARDRYGRLSFDTLYFGGGTPSSLSIPEIERLDRELRGAFEFKEGYEFTFEFNPGDGEPAKLAALHRIGVNRISLGCQSFSDTILQKLGRRHTVRGIEATVSEIRRAGITNISFDLMLRLPGQTEADFRGSVVRCIELGASQVSLYDLEVHGETPFGRLQKEGQLDLPAEEEHARMYETAIAMLTGAGYEHYEISNFAKPGMASRHNLIYWHNREYLGLGPGAFTYLNGVRSQRAAGFGRWLEKCRLSDWTNDTEDRLTDKEKETETLMTGLRLREGVRPGSFPKVYPQLKDRMEQLCREGLMEETGGSIRLTARGQFLSEDVFAFLLGGGVYPNE